jgi:hypothetical protein
MFFFLMFFSIMFLNSCSLAYQSHNSCDPLSFPPTSCSFNYELGGCKHARTCSFAHCLAIATCLTTCCAFVNPRFRFGIPMGMCTPTHLDFFVEGVSCIFYCCCSPSCIKLSLCMLIGYSLCCNCHLYYISSFIFFSIFFFFFARFPKYSIEVTTCDLE